MALRWNWVNVNCQNYNETLRIGDWKKRGLWSVGLRGRERDVQFMLT